MECMLCSGIPAVTTASEPADEVSGSVELTVLKDLLRAEMCEFKLELAALKDAVVGVQERLALFCGNESMSEADFKVQDSGIPGIDADIPSQLENATEACVSQKTSIVPTPDEETQHAVSLARIAGALGRPDAEALARRFPGLESTILGFDSIRSKIGQVEAPKRTDILSQIADNWWFQAAANVATVLNCAFLTYSADWQADNYSETQPDVISIIDIVFLGVFLLELVVRLGRHRCYYFCNSRYVMNWIDCVVVVGGLTEVVASAITSDVDLTFVRALRTFRLLRVLRVLQVAGMFRTLRAIVVSLSNTTTDILWCTIMIMMVQYMFALVFVMRTGSFLRSESHILTSEELEELTHVFGSTSSSMLHLFKVSMGGGDWAVDFKILQPTGYLNQALYLLFVVVSFIAILNVILGIFVDRAMKSLSPSPEEKAHEHAEEELKVEENLRNIFEEGDSDGDGTLSREEWVQAFSKGKLSNYMDVTGFRARDLQTYFKRCADREKSGKVDIDKLVKGCMRMRGQSSSFDVYNLRVELKKIESVIQEIKEATRSEKHHQPPLLEGAALAEGAQRSGLSY